MLDGHFFTLYYCKNCNVCLNRLKINETEASNGPFLLRISNIKVTCVQSRCCFRSIQTYINKSMKFRLANGIHYLIYSHVLHIKLVICSHWLLKRILLAIIFFSFNHTKTKNDLLGGRPGLVVMGGDPCSEGCGFESQYHILDGHFSHIFFVKL